MKVLLAGASGAIGTPLTRQLVAHDHQVLGRTRDWDGARRLQALGATPVVADALDRDGLLRAVDGLAAPYVASLVVGTSMRVSNAKATAELGWRPLYPNYRAGVHAMATATKEEPCRSPGRSGAGTRSA